MKRFLMFLIGLSLIATSCGTAAYTSNGRVYDSEDISYVLANYYPQLFEYYQEGVLRVNSVRRVTLKDGATDYIVKYKLVRYYYPTHTARISAVEAYLPELFDLYRHGMVSISSVYKYVDQSTGRILHHASYHWVYNYYPYGPWYGSYYYGSYRRLRPLPPPKPGAGRFPGVPPQARPPQNRPGPGGQPRTQPQPRPQTQPGNTNPGPRPGGNPGMGGGPGGPSRSAQGGSRSGNGGRR